MIADAHGVQPDSLKLEADQRLFHGMLDQATALAHGRNSGEGGPRHGAAAAADPDAAPVAGVARDPLNDKTVHWNPAGASLDEAWAALGLSGGLLAVIGGTDPFGLFLDIGYDAFHLSRAAQRALPGGRPVFPGIPPRTPGGSAGAARPEARPGARSRRSGRLTLVTCARGTSAARRRQSLSTVDNLWISLSLRKRVTNCARISTYPQ